MVEMSLEKRLIIRPTFETQVEFESWTKDTIITLVSLYQLFLNITDI